MELLMLADLASLNGGGDGRPQPQQLKESGPPGSVHDYLDCGTEFLATHDYYDRVPAAEFDFDHSYAFHISHASVTTLGVASREWNEEDCLPNNDCIAPNLPSNEEVIDSVIERAVMDNWKQVGTSKDNWKQIGTSRDNWKQIGTSRDNWKQIGTSRDNWKQIGTSIERAAMDNWKQVGTSCNEEKNDTMENTGTFSSCGWSQCSWNGPSSRLVGHVHKEHSTKSIDLCCKWNDCSRQHSFSKRYLFVRHLRRHTNERPYSCPICQLDFATSERLTLHDRALHLRQRPYACDACGKLFSTTADRRRHCRFTHGQMILQCSQCPLIFRTACSLRKHIKVRHG